MQIMSVRKVNGRDTAQYIQNCPGLNPVSEVSPSLSFDGAETFPPLLKKGMEKTVATNVPGRKTVAMRAKIFIEEESRWLATAINLVSLATEWPRSVSF